MNDMAIELIPVSQLIVDPAIQRELSATRVDCIASDFDPGALGVITVSRRRNGMNHIVDGQHRTAAAKVAKGDAFEMPCQVLYGLGVESEARLFRLLNNTRKVDALPLFRVRLVEGEQVATAINGVAAAHGWKIANHGSHGSAVLSAVAAMERLYRRGPEAFAQSIATITRAWGHEAQAGDGKLIEGIGLVYLKYGAAVELNELANRLRAWPGGPTRFLADAQSQRAILRCTITHAVAEVTVRAYNRGRRTKTLPSWRTE